MAAPTEGGTPFGEQTTVLSDIKTEDSPPATPVNEPTTAQSSVSATALSAPAQDLPLATPEEGQAMFRSLRQIFERIDDQNQDSELQKLMMSLELADKEFKAGPQNTIALTEVKSKVDWLWRSKSGYMAQTTDALANASRDRKWRPYFGRSGILEYYLRLVATDGVEEDILLHALRLIGNSCADTNENRKRVVDNNFTLPIMRLGNNPALVHVVIPVIYNICAEFAPAQVQFGKNGLSVLLLELLQADKLKGNALLGVTYELLEMVTEQGQVLESASIEGLSLMLDLATQPDISTEFFACLVSCIAAHIRIERFQQLCLANRLVGKLLSLLSMELEGNDQATTSMLRLKINHIISDISSLPTFPSFYPLGSPLTEVLMKWLSSNQEELVICGCVMLGNLARDDDICKSMIEDYDIHILLIAILKRENARGTILYSALGYLKNLAIAGDNREHLGAAGVIQAVSPLWALDSIPHAQLMAVSLARQTILLSIPNINILLSPLSSDNDSPASRRTYLSLILSLFGRTDDTSILTEIGRTIAALCRSTARLETGIEDRVFALHPDVARPIGFMITQTDWPVVQSEGWFALALMAARSTGTAAVVDCLQSMSVIENLCKTVRAVPSEPVDGESIHDKTTRLKIIKDRENALILLHGLAQHKASSTTNLLQSQSNLFAELLREAGHTSFVGHT
ncbi:hypothetical protein FQN57_006599 [Myotisia sp. PD_48]|nr:hypothetical protein FQN57_006599 [Myotisia sp. PD_48]